MCCSNHVRHAVNIIWVSIYVHKYTRCTRTIRSALLYVFAELYSAWTFWLKLEKVWFCIYYIKNVSTFCVSANLVADMCDPFTNSITSFMEPNIFFFFFKERCPTLGFSPMSWVVIVIMDVHFHFRLKLCYTVPYRTAYSYLNTHNLYLNKPNIPLAYIWILF